eukprot:5516009-Prymnesium_polylepis.1
MRGSRLDTQRTPGHDTPLVTRRTPLRRVAAAVVLGIGRLTAAASDRAKLSLKRCDSGMPQAKRQLAPAIALYLTLPCEATLIVDERDARASLQPAEMGGDPG